MTHRTSSNDISSAVGKLPLIRVARFLFITHLKLICQSTAYSNTGSIALTITMQTAQRTRNTLTDMLYTTIHI
jgi:hypothetical protein